MAKRRSIDPDELQAGVEAIRKELTAALRAKGYGKPPVTIEFGSPLGICVAMVGIPSPSTAYATTLTEAVRRAHARIATL